LGLKENVIIGKLIPAGTGYRGNNPSSDGPIESFEGVTVMLPAEEEEELEGEPEAEGVEAAPEAEAPEVEKKPERKRSEILGITTPV
ncbi:MAG: hypothetical protein PVG25_14375, partial [Anaerolineae bacterium]